MKTAMPCDTFVGFANYSNVMKLNKHRYRYIFTVADSDSDSAGDT